MKPLNDDQVKRMLDGAPVDGRPVRGLVANLFRALVQAAVVVAILAGSYLAVQRLVETRPDVPRRPPQERVYTIETVTARRDDHQGTIRAFGQVIAARMVELRALVAGTVTAVHPALQVGATVAAGDVLVTIDEFDYRGALAEAEANKDEAEARLAQSEARLALERDALSRAREQLEFAQRDLERVSQLRSRGRMTDRDLDERKLLVSQREQAVEQRLNNIRIEEAGARQQQAALARLQWRVEEAARRLADTRLRAPFGGVVLSENVEVGRVLNQNDVAVALYEDEVLEVRFQLTDRQYGEILTESGTIAGRPVEIRWYVGESPVILSGEILRAGAEIAAEKGGIEVYASVDKPGGAGSIRPGAFVELAIPGRRYPDSFRLPESAVYGGDHVFVVAGDRLQRRSVGVVGYGEESVYVTGEIAPGDKVLSTRIAEVGEGLKVRLESDAAVGSANGLPAGDGAPRRGRP